jgi:hypothetical protein
MKITLLLLVLNLSFLSLHAQIESKENEGQTLLKYNGKPVSEEQLLKLLNRDFIKFCREQKKISNRLKRKNRKTNRRNKTVPLLD